MLARARRADGGVTQVHQRSTRRQQDQVVRYRLQRLQASIIGGATVLSGLRVVAACGGLGRRGQKRHPLAELVAQHIDHGLRSGVGRIDAQVKAEEVIRAALPTKQDVELIGFRTNVTPEPVQHHGPSIATNTRKDRELKAVVADQCQHPAKNGLIHGLGMAAGQPVKECDERIAKEGHARDSAGGKRRAASFCSC
ncbi:hypothetical protein [Chitinolyticbacter meiyuanensis]|uniref:hypothetical protein n=1 Tax=Chitinolyticbacter meiyuanensis TaxID=682798 RepID=UPI0011E5D555|nr:hypothetical protein [Chitinolyticbacter meiyuanensis]